MVDQTNGRVPSECERVQSAQIRKKTGRRRRRQYDKQLLNEATDRKNGSKNNGVVINSLTGAFFANSSRQRWGYSTQRVSWHAWWNLIYIHVHLKQLRDGFFSLSLSLYLHFPTLNNAFHMMWMHHTHPRMSSHSVQMWNLFLYCAQSQNLRNYKTKNNSSSNEKAQNHLIWENSCVYKHAKLPFTNVHLRCCVSTAAKRYRQKAWLWKVILNFSTAKK